MMATTVVDSEEVHKGEDIDRKNGRPLIGHVPHAREQTSGATVRKKGITRAVPGRTRSVRMEVEKRGRVPGRTNTARARQWAQGHTMGYQARGGSRVASTWMQTPPEPERLYWGSYHYGSY